MPIDPALKDHQAWLGYLQPDGLVVSPAALVDLQVILPRDTIKLQEQFLGHIRISSNDDGEISAITDFADFARRFLEWPDDCLFGLAADRPLPDTLKIPLPEFEETLEPSAAFAVPKPKDPSNPWLLLIQVLPRGTDMDAPTSTYARGWQASPARKLERLLRETRVPIGLISNGTLLRLVYAPRGENAGSLTFPVYAMAEIAGRPILAAFHQLLNRYRLIAAPSDQRLPALLSKSREYQSSVSTALAEQVLDALYELVRGFQTADERTKGELLKKVLAERPDDVYAGLLTVLMRLVFLLFAEDRGLMPGSSLYVQNYAVHGLFEKLRADNERYPDTMDHRFGAWAQLLALFRAVFNGSRHPQMAMPARRGYLFDPKRFPFLEGNTISPAQLPLVSDGVIFRVLRNLLLLDGERLSYRTLDVEQIGSVYETMMGFRLEVALGPMIAIKPAKSHGAPTAINLDELLAVEGIKRAKWLTERTDQKLTGEAANSITSATNLDALLAALERKIARSATPHPVQQGGMVLQPSDERRRSGSHYTPRSLTEPIVRTTLRPVLERLGEHPMPDQILDLKVCDIAQGSGAFLVETCRQLADELVTAWHYHGVTPTIPPDEDEVLHARRIIAQRCLYGVDKNPMAVDLAKLSLWLATLAKDHPFTFLDHSIRCGDSLVGLRKHQISDFHWKDEPVRVLGQEIIEERIKTATKARKEILEAGDFITPELKRQKLDLADEALDLVREAGDLVIASFFGAEKDRTRQTLRDQYLALFSESSKDMKLMMEARKVVNNLRSGDRPVMPFHWEIEFPEVFGRDNPGFDAIVGNPPFLGAKGISGSYSSMYLNWLSTTFQKTSGQVDLVAYFFRMAFILIRREGTFGLIGTRTIAKGDTREGGLFWIKMQNGQIYSATRRIQWPGEAAVQVSTVHISKDCTVAPIYLDGKIVANITCFLFDRGPDESPLKLISNQQTSFPGFYNYGDGFIFCDGKDSCTPIDEMNNLILESPRNKERISPFIGGDDLLYTPDLKPSRYVIDFADMSEMEAARWPDLLRIVRDRVYPERQKQNRERRKRFWWQFGEVSPGLRHAISCRNRVLMHPYTTKFSVFAFIPTTTYVASPNYVFAFNDDSDFCVLQSRVHEMWAQFFGGAREDRLVYTASDCFETFPFPHHWHQNDFLDRAGRAYYDFRASVLVKNSQGLTDTYNRFHDPEETSPDILRLWELHAAMDRAVLDAYGWNDIPTDCDFILDYEEEDDDEDSGHRRKKPWRYRWPDPVRDEVLARLLALNAQRAKEERLAGMVVTAPTSATNKPKAARAKRGGKKKGYEALEKILDMFSGDKS